MSALKPGSARAKRYPYLFAWGNNEIRRDYKGQFCCVVARGRMRSVLVEFENGERLLTSERALRKHEPAPTLEWPT